MLPSGHRLGHYRIVSELGVGGMGEVYLAEDTRLRRNVALKLLPQAVAADEQSRRRLMREAQVAATLEHTNICTVYEVGEAEGHTFIAMQYVQGQTLAARLKQGPLDLPPAVAIAAQVAAALAEAHRHGIVHRDIKPQNIMLTAGSQVKVLDFGIATATAATEVDARTITRLTEAGAIAGTVPYMSPEQIRGEPLDARSDVFSIGCVLYEMIGHVNPFLRGHAADTMSAILTTDPAPLSKASVPAELQRIVRKCLEKDRERRYQSTRELVEDLEALRHDLETQPLTGTPRAPAPAPGPASKKTLSRVVYSSVAALAAVVIAVALYVSMRQEKPPATVAASMAAAPTARLSDGALASSSAEANEYYEKGLLFLRSRYNVPRAIEMFERALRLDPHFAEARAYHAFSQFLLIDGGYSNDAGLLYKAEEETRQALEDNPRSPIALSARPAVLLYQGRKELVPGEVHAALQVNPDSPDAKLWLVNYHQLNGDYAAAEALAREILQNAPLFFPARMNLAEMRRQQGDFADAVRQFEKILEQDPENIYAIQKLARAYAEKGDLRSARLALEGARPDHRRNYEIRLGWAVQLALEGQRAPALEEMDADVLKFVAMVPHLTSRAAEFYAALSDAPKALEWLEVALRNGDERAEWFSRNPLLANIRSEPRFKQILDSIALRRQSRAKAPAAR